jgi:hypothetical protein
MRAVLLIPLLTLAVAANAHPVTAQGVTDRDDWCDRDRGGDRERGWFCEVREVMLPATGDVVTVDGAPNGGIRVEGWDRNEVLLRARVSARAASDEDARELVSLVEVLTGRSPIHASGPRTGRREWWSVSYELLVPRRSNLNLSTRNGGIRITEVTGQITFHSTNGGVALNHLGGNVRGSATNGGLDIDLGGDAWEGEGMDVQTANGGVEISVPQDYSARLETGTVNGGMRIDFPIMLQGRFNRRITTDLGRGGKTIRAVTTNGGVVVRRG